MNMYRAHHKNLERLLSYLKVLVSIFRGEKVWDAGDAVIRSEVKAVPLEDY